MNTKSPPFLPLFSRVALAQIRSKFRSSPQINDVEKGVVPAPLRLSCVLEHIDEKHFRAYQQITQHNCKKSFPLLYPQVLAGPLMYWLMSDERFGFGLLGIVHTKHWVKQSKTICATQPISIECILHPIFQDANQRGWRFWIETNLTDSSGELLWQSKAEFLIRKKPSHRKNEAKPTRKNPEIVSSALLQSNPLTIPLTATTRITRSYAQISQDFNPIHVSSFLARRFGFKNAIAHGLWNMALCANTIQSRLSAQDLWLNELQFDFVGPWYLPSTKNLFLPQSLPNHRGDFICEVGDPTSLEVVARGAGNITDRITS